MWFGFVTVLPEIIDAGLVGGVFARGVDKGLLQVSTYNPRDYTDNKHRSIDDRPYGGGAGMVMMYQPLLDALRAAQVQAPRATKVVLMSPQGQRFEQHRATDTAKSDGLIIICGRYEGLDERFVQAHVDEEWSVGDFVLSGGELPGLIVADAISRHIPGILGNSLSIIDESHLDGRLDYPHYTRPEQVGSFGTGEVPAVLLSGDHNRIADYRRREALQRTYTRRPDMLTQKIFSVRDRKLLRET